VENQAYVEKIQDLMSISGNKLEVIVRVSPASQYLAVGVASQGQTVHPAQQRIDNYYKDEIIAYGGKIR